MWICDITFRWFNHSYMSESAATGVSHEETLWTENREHSILLTAFSFHFYPRIIMLSCYHDKDNTSHVTLTRSRHLHSVTTDSFPLDRNWTQSDISHHLAATAATKSVVPPYLLMKGFNHAYLGCDITAILEQLLNTASLIRKTFGKSLYLILHLHY